VSASPHDPYAAPAAAVIEAEIDLAIERAAGVHDRHPQLARAVGDNFGLYARRWHLDAPSGRWPRPWHWPAFLFDFFWLLYRRLYLAAALMLVLEFGIGAAVAFSWIGENGSLVLLVGTKVLLGLSANALYLWHCRRLVGRTQARYRDQPARIAAELDRRGGVSKMALGLGFVLYVVIRVLAGD
jgi:hypothetical protein